MPKFKAGQPTATTAPASEANKPQASRPDIAAEPQTFSLILKSIGTIGWGLDDLQKAGDEAGLVWSPRSTVDSDKHIPGELKAVPVADLIYRRTGEYCIGKKHHEVRLTMDLMLHSSQCNALLIMRRVADKMAESLGAIVQLEDGTPVCDDTIASADKLIQEVHAARRQAARKLTPMPDGRVKEADDRIPWRAYVSGPQGGGRREWLEFDVSPETYYRGNARGHALMLELLTNLKALTEPGRQSLSIGNALGEALGVNWRKAVKYRGKSRSNVASGMLDVIEEALRFFARNANFERWLEQQIGSTTRTAEIFEKEDAILREQRSVRSKIAHARKRQAAAEPAKKTVPLAQKIAAANASGGGGRRMKRAAEQAVPA